MPGYGQKRHIQYDGYLNRPFPNDYHELVTDKIRNCYLMYRDDSLEREYVQQEVSDWRYVLFICDDIVKDKDSGRV